MSASTTLAQGKYFRDRWAATSGGCVLSFDGLTASLDGTVGTIIDVGGFAGRKVTFSLENPQGDIHVGLSAFGTGTGSVNGLIEAGEGQCAVTLDVPATATGSLVLELATTEAVEFDVRLRLEIGPLASPWEPADEMELQRCERHWCKSFPMSVAPTDTAEGSSALIYAAFTYHATNGNLDTERINFPVRMRATPLITFYASYSADTPGVWHAYFNSAWQGGGVIDSVVANRTSETGFVPRVNTALETLTPPIETTMAVEVAGHWTADARPSMAGVNSSWVGLL